MKGYKLNNGNLSITFLSHVPFFSFPSPKAAVQSIVSRLKDSNPNVVLLALQVFESVVKNCGQSVHEQVASRAVMEQVHDVLRTNPNEEVRKKILLLLSTWVYAFRNEPKYRAVQVSGKLKSCLTCSATFFYEKDGAKIV